MAEYIDRKALGIGRCDPAVFENKGYAEGWNNAIKIIQSAPAADVRPVVRGKWKDAVQGCGDSPHVQCSICGEYYFQYFKKFGFCPKCGAEMAEMREADNG